MGEPVDPKKALGQLTSRNKSLLHKVKKLKQRNAKQFGEIEDLKLEKRILELENEYLKFHWQGMYDALGPAADEIVDMIEADWDSR